jgi:hypothetical protein
MSTPPFPAEATNRFFDRPSLNSPYEHPGRHWELDSEGQPTQKIIEMRRRAEFITPIPKAKKQKANQTALVFNEGKGLSNEKQQYDPTSIINELRAVAIAMRDGPEAGLKHIDPVLAHGELANYYLAHSARADLCRRLGRTAEARSSYEKALALTQQEPERHFLQERIRQLK